MLLSVVRKVLTSVITRRTTHHASTYVRESQAGFRAGRSTADGVFYSRSLCERALLGNWSYSAAPLDFSGAFDTVQRKEALERLAEAGAATRATSTLISNTSAKVKLQSRLSSPFETNIGVVQGDPLSPVMCIMYTEHAIRKINELCPVTSVPSPSSQYADDTTLHANDRQDVEQLVCNCEPTFIEDNLQLNKSQTQYIIFNKKDNSWKSITLLGSLLGSMEDVATRINAANRAFATIPWKWHSLSSGLNMFSVLILPVLLYNCGQWILTSKLSNSLDVWHRRKLRFLLGISTKDHVNNTTLYKRAGQELMATTCRKRRLLRLGHVIREGPGSISYDVLKMSINTKAIKKPRGRPPKHWIDGVEEDLWRGGYSLSECFTLAANKTLWLKAIDRCV